MNLSTIARHHSIAALLVAAAASVSAAEGTQDFKDDVLSTRSRAEVQAELANARATGQLEQRGETYGSFGAREITSSLTRAEVIADFQLWRESGMADMSFGDVAYDAFSDRYRQAMARYVQLRSSPRYAQLVQTIAERRGEVPAGVPVAASAR